MLQLVSVCLSPLTLTCYRRASCLVAEVILNQI